MDTSIDQFLRIKVGEFTRDSLNELLDESKIVQVVVRHEFRPLMTYSDFAKCIGGHATPDKVRAWCRDPNQPAMRIIKMGRYAYVDVEYFMKNRDLHAK